MLCVTAAYLETGVEVKSAPDSTAATVMVIGSGRAVLEIARDFGWVRADVKHSGGRDGYFPEAALAPTDLNGLSCGSPDYGAPFY